jgi:hypothetical protein
VAASPVLIGTDTAAGAIFPEDLDDSAKLFVVGMMLVGVAIAVRRAV